MTSEDIVEAFINPQILIWARTRLHYSRRQAAERFGVTTETLVAWESGQSRPSFKQAQDVAKQLNIPLGYLWLSAPPKVFSKVRAEMKLFLSILLGVLAFHVVEDTIWVMVSRYTDAPLWALYCGIVPWALVMTGWAWWSTRNQSVRM